MKIIDLLNKIANGEKVPKKIKINDEELYYDENARIYYTTEQDEYFGNMPMSFYDLNDEVEIIEEDKKIEHIGIPVIDGDNTCNELMKSINVITEDISNKINEIIDKLNEMSDKE